LSYKRSGRNCNGSPW